MGGASAGMRGGRGGASLSLSPDLVRRRRGGGEENRGAKRRRGKEERWRRRRRRLARLQSLRRMENERRDRGRKWAGPRKPYGGLSRQPGRAGGDGATGRASPSATPVQVVGHHQRGSPCRATACGTTQWFGRATHASAAKGARFDYSFLLRLILKY